VLHPLVGNGDFLVSRSQQRARGMGVCIPITHLGFTMRFSNMKQTHMRKLGGGLAWSVAVACKVNVPPSASTVLMGRGAAAAAAAATKRTYA
jgi:hypothetical protein